MPFLGNPVSLQLMKNLQQPNFKGTSEDWPKFVLAWENYIAKLAPGQKLPDDQKLQLIEACLDETSKSELQFYQKICKEKATFAAFWAKLAERFGEDMNTHARKRWKDLTLVSTGKIQEPHWREFRIKFYDIWSDIPQANEEEAYQTLIGKLPDFIMAWVIEEQEKQKFRKPQVIISPLVGMGEVQIAQSLQAIIGVKPRAVGRRNASEVVVELSDPTEISKTLLLDGKKIQGGTTLKVVKNDQHLTVEQLFNQVGKKLMTRMKVDINYKSKEGWGKRKERSLSTTKGKPAVSDSEASTTESDA